MSTVKTDRAEERRQAPAPPEPASGILRAEHLSAGYHGMTVLGDVQFSAVPGTLVTLIGPNGAGKSTLLKTLIRQLGPLSGTVYLDGADMAGLREREIARSVSAVLTGRPSPELMTCGDVVCTGRYPYTGPLGILSPEDRRIAAESMELVRVSELRDRDFSRVSDGQRQRVLLARAICQQPRVLILDEPTSFLDIRHKLDFLYLLRELARARNLAVILSLHELELAQRFSDTVLCVAEGRIDRQGPPEEIFTGDYINTLYGVSHGGYQPLLGSVETGPLPGPPEVFVVGGGGSGIPVYRLLRRRGIPFAAGVLPENDADLPVAAALSDAVVTDSAYEPVSAAAVDRALALAKTCRRVLCTQERFGTVNRENRRIVEWAKKSGRLADTAATERPAGAGTGQIFASEGFQNTGP